MLRRLLGFPERRGQGTWQYVTDSNNLTTQLIEATATEPLGDRFQCRAVTWHQSLSEVRPDTSAAMWGNGASAEVRAFLGLSWMASYELRGVAYRDGWRPFGQTFRLFWLPTPSFWLQLRYRQQESLAGAFGLIMTRDLFNTFVFLEVVSIATYALAATGDESRGLEAGFKYMFLGAVASAFILIGIAMLYRLTGTLSIDGIAEALARRGAGAMPTLGVGVVLLFLFAGFLVELKVFPLNGPAIDLYDGVSPAVMALTVGTALNASVYAFWKLMPILHTIDLTLVLMTVGGATFVLANLFALRQARIRRMLGYSTSAQLGLIVMLMPLAFSGEIPATAVGLLLVNHTLAKAGLLWFAGAVGAQRLEEWKGVLAHSPAARLTLAALVLAIVGMPPFPGFWGKKLIC